MNAPSSMLHVRLDNELKAKATEALAAMGLTASDAVRLLFHRIAVDQVFPLELKVPNAETRAAIEESRRSIKAGGVRFTAAQEVFNALDQEARQQQTG